MVSEEHSFTVGKRGNYVRNAAARRESVFSSDDGGKFEDEGDEEYTQGKSADRRRRYELSILPCRDTIATDSSFFQASPKRVGRRPRVTSPEDDLLIDTRSRANRPVQQKREMKKRKNASPYSKDTKPIFQTKHKGRSDEKGMERMYANC